MRKGFTLIEVMISITILSIIMLFLYKSFAELNMQNRLYDEESAKIKKLELIKQTFFLDLSAALVDNNQTVTILPQEKTEDIVFFQSTHSIHNRINPYIGYIVKDENLYRIESLHAHTTYPVPLNIDFDIDYLGAVENFRLYKATDPKKHLYLLDMFLKEKGRILLKIKSFS